LHYVGITNNPKCLHHNLWAKMHLANLWYFYSLNYFTSTMSHAIFYFANMATNILGTPLTRLWMDLQMHNGTYGTLGTTFVFLKISPLWQQNHRCSISSKCLTILFLLLIILISKFLHTAIHIAWFAFFSKLLLQSNSCIHAKLVPGDGLSYPSTN
jgi:hypothetical protein